jgi:hypothetical protein
MTIMSGAENAEDTQRARRRSAISVDPRELFEMALLIAALLANDFLLPRVLFGDGLDRFNALDKLLREGALSASRYSLIGPIFAAPLWWLGNLNGGLIGAEAETQRYNSLLFGLGIIALYLILRRHIEGRLLRAFLLLLALASMLPYHLTQFYAEVFTAVLVAVGLSMATLSARARRRWAGWALTALGVANTPATLAGLALVAGQRVWASGRLRYFLGPLMAVALIMGESLLRRGSLFTNGYEHDTGGMPPDALLGGWLPGFNYPFLFGLLGLLFSFGKGVVFYAPGLLLPVRSRLRALGASGSALWRLHVSWLLFVAGLVLVYASWWDWSGDWFWGPRFLLFASVPASFALALWTQRPSSRLWANLLALFALAFSVWVGIDGAIFGQADLKVCFFSDRITQDACRFDLTYSALWRPLLNLFQYGPGPRFMAVEGLTTNGILYALIATAIGVYLSLPLLRTIASQLRALLNEWAPIARKRLARLRV